MIGRGEFIKLNNHLFKAEDALTGWAFGRKKISLKAALLILKDWDNWYRVGSNGKPSPEDVSQMIDELEFLLDDFQEAMILHLGEVERELKKARAITNPLFRELCLKSNDGEG
ncbi:MAG: hypothetical protein ACM37W_23015 [Actinomycetota bacterium]